MAIAKNPKVIMTSGEFINRLKAIAGRKTYYCNRYPYNLCYIHNDGRTSADCSNLVKAILNGYDVNNKAVGYYQRDLSNTGDCTEAELLSQCTDVSDNFKDIKAPAILYMSGHIGTYIGITPDNRFNVIECTTAWGGGVIYSWVDQDGTRRSENGGKPIVLKNGTYQRWSHWGLPTRWVSFNAQTPIQNAPQAPTTSEKPKSDSNTYPVLKKGSKGESVKELQRLLEKKGFSPKGIDGDFGNNTLSALKRFQEAKFVTGVTDERTWKELYK